MAKKQEKVHGSKPVKRGTKCSYIGCDKDAISYNYSPSRGLAVCENHGGIKQTKVFVEETK